MRIAFAGASGTGKSTLAHWLSDTCILPINPVGSRTVSEKMGFSSPYDVDAAGQRSEFQRRLQSEKIAWETSADSFVTDRTTLDELLYTSLHDVKTAISTEYFARAFAHTERYDLIIHCPFDVFCDTAGDPKRLASREYQSLFDTYLGSLLRRAEIDHGVSVLDLLEPGLAERKALIGHVLEGFGVRPVLGLEVAS